MQLAIIKANEKIINIAEDSMVKNILGIIILIFYYSSITAGYNSPIEHCSNYYCSASQQHIHTQMFKDIKVYNLSDKLIAQQLWTKRVIVIYTPSRDNQQYRKQIELFAKQGKSLQARDVIIMVQHGRKTFHTSEHKDSRNGFRVVLIGKDGGIKKTFTTPVTASQVNNIIDEMPMRKHEISRRRE